MRDRSRFEALLPRPLIADRRILLIGCGGIGSFIAPTLVKMGAKNLTLVDFDNVEPTNLATQNFTRYNVESRKVHALADLCYGMSDEDRYEDEDTPLSILALPERFAPEHLTHSNDPTGDRVMHDIVIPAVDNIETRREVWEWVRALSPPNTLVLDPRTGAETLDLYAIRNGQGWDDWYTNVLAENGYADDPCGARAIAYTGSLAASVVCSVLRHCLLDEALQLWLTADLDALGGPAMRTNRTTVETPTAAPVVVAA